MVRRLWSAGIFAVLGMSAAARAGGTTTDAVVAYVPGAISSASLQVSGAAAVGLPTSVDDGQTSPFSPPFHASSITIVGAGGEITLHFAQTVAPTGGLDVGVFTNTGLAAQSSGGVITAKSASNGAGGTTAATLGMADTAIVSVSADDVTWVSLFGGSAVNLSMPSNAFRDGTFASGEVSGGTMASNPYQPFSGTLSDFAGLTYPQMATLLDGSFGGAWIDLSSSGLSAVNYIRFDVPTGDRLVLDAVTAANAVPEPATCGWLLLGLGALCVRRRRRSGRGVTFISLSGRTLVKKQVVLASALVLSVGGASAFAQPFVMNGTTYQVQDVAGSGSNEAVLELDFGTNASPQAYLFGYEWDGSTTPNGRDVLAALQADGNGLSFTDTFFPSFDEYQLNTLWYQGNQPADDYPNAFWFYFSSPDGQTWSETDEGYDQTAVTNGGFFAWSLQHDDPNEFVFSPPFLPPSHSPAAIVATSAAPEPGTLALAGLGVMGLCARRRR